MYNNKFPWGESSTIWVHMRKMLYHYTKKKVFFLCWKKKFIWWSHKSVLTHTWKSQGMDRYWLTLHMPVSFGLDLPALFLPPPFLLSQIHIYSTLKPKVTQLSTQKQHISRGLYSGNYGNTYLVVCRNLYRHNH